MAYIIIPVIKVFNNLFIFFTITWGQARCDTFHIPVVARRRTDNPCNIPRHTGFLSNTYYHRSLLIPRLTITLRRFPADDFAAPCREERGR
jgi:hypothetical protein